MKCPICHVRMLRHCNNKRECKWRVCQVCKLVCDPINLRAAGWNQTTGAGTHFKMVPPSTSEDAAAS